MNYVRWYDKNPKLKEIFGLISKLDKQYQNIIAHDILQIVMNDLGIDLDYEINKISANYNYECKRWYDKNIDLFMSFELIKSLPDRLKDDVVQKTIESTLLMYVQEGGQ